MLTCKEIKIFMVLPILITYIYSYSGSGLLLGGIIRSAAAFSLLLTIYLGSCAHSKAALVLLAAINRHL